MPIRICSINIKRLTLCSCHQAQQEQKVECEWQDAVQTDEIPVDFCNHLLLSLCDETI
jgi:hypothetical protein